MEGTVLDSADLFWVLTERFTGGVLVFEGQVVGTAPCYKWMRGKSWAQCRGWSKIIEIKPAPGRVQAEVEDVFEGAEASRVRPPNVGAQRPSGRYETFLRDQTRGER